MMKIIPADIVFATEVKKRYKKHEVAARTLTHPRLTKLNKNDDCVAKNVKEQTDVQYARTITSTLNF